MVVKTLVLLALILTTFCIGLSQGLKCYVCEVDKDGAGCLKPDKSFLKKCREIPTAKISCLEMYKNTAGDKSLEKRGCDYNYPYAGCHIYIPESGAKKKMCNCFEDGCNNKGPVSELNCYQCKVQEDTSPTPIDGPGCHKPEESFLKKCPPAKEGGGEGQFGCASVFAKAGNNTNTGRGCTDKPVTDPAGCKDVPQKDPGAEAKACVCYENGCNTEPSPYYSSTPGLNNFVSFVPFSAALLLNIILYINYYYY